jgi:hypothetical protein
MVGRRRRPTWCLVHTAKVFFPLWDLFCNGMAFLPDGRALIVGGTETDSPFTGDARATIFDPMTEAPERGREHGPWTLVRDHDYAERRPDSDLLYDPATSTPVSVAARSSAQTNMPQRPFPGGHRPSHASSLTCFRSPGHGRDLTRGHQRLLERQGCACILLSLDSAAQSRYPRSGRRVAALTPNADRPRRRLLHRLASAFRRSGPDGTNR